MALYIMEYRPLAAVTVGITVLILWFLVKKYSNSIRTIAHVYFAILTFYPLFLLGYYITGVPRRFSELQARAAELLGVTSFPEALFVEVEPLPMWVMTGFFLTMSILAVGGAIFWLYDIKKKQNVYDYTKMPKWQKYLTLFLVFYGLTYLHAMLFGSILGGRPDIYLMYGLYPCPVNLVLVAILVPLVPRVNKPLYVIMCFYAIGGAFFNQMIGLSVNLDALAVSPVGVYGLIMLWRSMRQKVEKK